MKSSAQLVVHAATGHLLQTQCHKIAPFLPAGTGEMAKEEGQAHGSRKLGRSREAAVSPVKTGGQLIEGQVEAGGRHFAGARREGVHGRQALHDVRTPSFNLLFLFSIGLGEGQTEPPEAGASEAVLRREIGPPVKRDLIGSQKHGHGPAAASGGHLNVIHVEGIQVGPFLSIDLDVHEVGVHDFGDGFIFERLPLHDMAPVASRITDAEQNRLVFPLGLVQGFLPPGVPVHWIVGMLSQIGTGLVDQSVGKFGFRSRIAGGFHGCFL